MPFPVKQAFVGTVSLPWSTLFTFCQFMKYAVYIWPEKNCFDPQMSKDEQNFQTRNFWHKKNKLGHCEKIYQKGSLSPRSSNVHDSRMDPFPWRGSVNDQNLGQSQNCSEWSNSQIRKHAHFKKSEEKTVILVGRRKIFCSRGDFLLNVHYLLSRNFGNLWVYN